MEKETFNLSPSSLSLFNDCRRCFWLTLHNKWQRPKGIFPSLPSGIDLVLKEYFDGYMEKNQLPPELNKDIRLFGSKLFSDFEKLQEWRDNRRGLVYQDSEGNIIRGAIDNLIIREDKLIVLDYKTRGSPPKDDTPDYYILQLSLYSFLLRKLGYKTEDLAYLLFYYPSHIIGLGQIIFNTSLVEVKLDIDKAEETWRSALFLLNNNCPKESCEWCNGAI